MLEATRVTAFKHEQPAEAHTVRQPVVQNNPRPPRKGGLETRGLLQRVPATPAITQACQATYMKCMGQAWLLASEKSAIPAALRPPCVLVAQRLNQPDSSAMPDLALHLLVAPSCIWLCTYMVVGTSCGRTLCSLCIPKSPAQQKQSQQSPTNLDQPLGQEQTKQPGTAVRTCSMMTGCVCCCVCCWQTPFQCLDSTSSLHTRCPFVAAH